LTSAEFSLVKKRDKQFRATPLMQTHSHGDTHNVKLSLDHVSSVAEPD